MMEIVSHTVAQNLPQGRYIYLYIFIIICPKLAPPPRREIPANKSCKKFKAFKIDKKCKLNMNSKSRLHFQNLRLEITWSPGDKIADVISSKQWISITLKTVDIYIVTIKSGSTYHNLHSKITFSSPWWWIQKLFFSNEESKYDVQSICFKGWYMFTKH